MNRPKIIIEGYEFDFSGAGVTLLTGRVNVAAPSFHRAFARALTIYRQLQPISCEYVYLMRERTPRRRFKIGHSRTPFERAARLNCDLLHIIPIHERVFGYESAVQKCFESRLVEGEYFRLRRADVLSIYRCKTAEDITKLVRQLKPPNRDSLI